MKSILRSLFDWIIWFSSFSIVSIAFVRFYIYQIKSDSKLGLALTFHWFFSSKASTSSSDRNANRRPLCARGCRDSGFASGLLGSRSLPWLLLWMISRPTTLNSLWFDFTLDWLYCDWRAGPGPGSAPEAAELTPFWSLCAPARTCFIIASSLFITAWQTSLSSWLINFSIYWVLNAIG